MAPVFLILNGKSATNQLVREAVQNLRDQNISLEVRVTWDRGDCARFLQEAVTAQASRVVIGGGDGSLNEAVNGLLTIANAQRPSLAVLPLGTANDFATSAAIPLEPLPALQLAIEGKISAVDIACVNDCHYFINMATGGFGTKITTETPEKLKSALGGVSYFLHGLLRMDRLQADRCTITGDDCHWQGDALVLAIGNGRLAGGGQRLCPTATIDDRLLELTIITHQELLPSVLHAVTSDEHNPNIISYQGRSFTLTSPHPMTFNLDGEPLSGEQFHFALAAEQIDLVLPPNCPLLR